MREKEALWLQMAFSCYTVEELSPCINIGSSTKEFREKIKPHIYTYLLHPLMERGIKVIHFDLKEADGVDLAGDIYDDKVLESLKKLSPRSLLCSNVFEHVRDPVNLANRLDRLLGEKGLIFVTVPYSYPYHPDPIDTLYRPSPNLIASLFPGYNTELKAILEECTYLDEIREMEAKERLWKLLKLFFPFYSLRKWVSQLHRLMWIQRPYRITCVVLRKSSA